MDYLILQASTFAEKIDNVIWLVVVLGGFWLLLAEAALFYLIFHFRKKAHPRAQYVTGDKHSEKQWIHWPHNLIIICDIVIVAFAVQGWFHVKQDLPPAQETIKVVAKQWAWKFTHPGPDGVLGTDDDLETVDELHVKVGTVYHFKLHSEDVLHDFSIPVFRLKQDAIPGRVMTGWFEPTKTGVFDIQCAEMCGIGHGIMGARIHVQSEQEYERWYDKTKEEQLRLAGKDPLSKRSRSVVAKR